MDTKLQSGVKVFGSAVLRVEPDVASLQFAVSRQAKQPIGASWSPFLVRLCPGAYKRRGEPLG